MTIHPNEFDPDTTPATTEDLNRTTTGDVCDVCGTRADEIARGVFWRHPQCIRYIAARSTSEYIRQAWEASKEGDGE